MDSILKAMNRARGEPTPAPNRPQQPAVPDSTLATTPPERVVSRKVRLDRAALVQGHVMLPRSGGAASEAYRMLRTQVLRRMEKHGISSLAVVSPMAGEGRTLTAINLAMSIAEDPDRTAMLVDLDLWSPSVATRLGIATSSGVADCLSGARDPAEVMCRVEDCPKLVVIPGGPGSRLPSELLAGDAARRLSEEWRSRYANRIVVYDLPPLLATDHAIVFMPNVQAALLVIEEGSTRRDDLARCMELLRDTPLLGTVLNRSVERPLGS